MESPKEALKKRYELIAPHLDERTKRLWCAAEAQSLGHGGVTQVQEVTGVSRSCITRGKHDLEDAPVGRVRRPGGGRKRTVAKDPELLADLDALLEPTVRGDPMRGLRWTCKSTRKLAQELSAKGHTVGASTIGKELRAQKFSLQGNRKTQEGSKHPDRNAQFEHIHATASAFQERGEPVISIDTKKKELIGNFKNGGKEWAPEGKPQEVKVHDALVVDDIGALQPWTAPLSGYEARQSYSLRCLRFGAEQGLRQCGD